MTPHRRTQDRPQLKNRLLGILGFQREWVNAPSDGKGEFDLPLRSAAMALLMSYGRRCRRCRWSCWSPQTAAALFKSHAAAAA